MQSHISSSEASQSTSWYALQTKARLESVAEHNLGNQGFTTFLPWLHRMRRRRGQWHRVTEPLFPGYLFIELNLALQNTAPIRSTRGVIRLVRQGESVRALPDSLVQGLMQAQAASGIAIDPEELFKPGDSVTLLDGPMAGLEAIFKARNSQERVIVLLSLLGTEVQVSISHHLLAKTG